jgi:hypothetical protein
VTSTRVTPSPSVHLAWTQLFFDFFLSFLNFVLPFFLAFLAYFRICLSVYFLLIVNPVSTIGIPSGTAPPAL